MVPSNNCQPGRIVAAIFKAAQSIEQNRSCFCFTDITDNPAHKSGGSVTSTICGRNSGSELADQLAFRTASGFMLGKAHDSCSGSTTWDNPKDARHHYGRRCRNPPFS